MEMIVLNANGSRTDAVLLAASSDRLRVVLRKGKDTIELRLDEGKWVSEAGKAYEVEAWITADGFGSELPCRGLTRHASAA